MRYFCLSSLDKIAKRNGPEGPSLEAKRYSLYCLHNSIDTSQPDSFESISSLWKLNMPGFPYWLGGRAPAPSAFKRFSKWIPSQFGCQRIWRRKVLPSDTFKSFGANISKPRITTLYRGSTAKLGRPREGFEEKSLSIAMDVVCGIRYAELTAPTGRARAVDSADRILL